MDRTELEMKKLFVAKISDAVEETSEHVKRIEYKVVPEESEYGLYYTEYLVMHYAGGAIQARDCTANSIIAILEEVPKMMCSSQVYPSDTARYKKSIGGIKS